MNSVLFEIGTIRKKKLRENTEEPSLFQKKCFNSKSNRKLNCSNLKKAPATNRNVKLYRNIEKKGFVETSRKIFQGLFRAQRNIFRQFRFSLSHNGVSWKNTIGILRKFSEGFRLSIDCTMLQKIVRIWQVEANTCHAFFFKNFMNKKDTQDGSLLP